VEFFLGLGGGVSWFMRTRGAFWVIGWRVLSAFVLVLRDFGCAVVSGFASLVFFWFYFLG